MRVGGVVITKLWILLVFRVDCGWNQLKIESISGLALIDGDLPDAVHQV